MSVETVRGFMQKLKGPGYWVLRAADQHSYAITGGDKALRQEGLEVEIIGTIVRTSIGLSKSSGLFQVQSYRVLAPPPKAA